jgi:hypothetical protein
MFLFDTVKIVKLEELLDNMKTTKGNIPSPGEYVLSMTRKIYPIADCSVAFKWLKSVEIDFNPQGDLQQLQDINQFIAAKCEYNILEIVIFLFSSSH